MSVNYGEDQLDPYIFAEKSNLVFRTLFENGDFQYITKFWKLIGRRNVHKIIDLKLALSVDRWLVINNTKHAYSAALRLSKYYSTGCQRVSNMDGRMGSSAWYEWGNCKPNRKKERIYFEKMLSHKSRITNNIRHSIEKADFYFKYRKNKLAAWWYAVSADLVMQSVDKDSQGFKLREAQLTSQKISALSERIDKGSLSSEISNLLRILKLSEKMQTLVDAGMTTLSMEYGEKKLKTKVTQ